MWNKATYSTTFVQYVWSRLKFGFRFEEFINTTFGAIFGRKVKSLNILITSKLRLFEGQKFFLQLKRNSLERFRVTCERTITVTANISFPTTHDNVILLK